MNVVSIIIFYCVPIRGTGKDILQHWDGVDRRRENGAERRDLSDRRLSAERRFDSRNSQSKSCRSLKAWFRSLSNARLGVDRRKGGDRRVLEDRRSQELRSLLTAEELADLLR